MAGRTWPAIVACVWVGAGALAAQPAPASCAPIANADALLGEGRIVLVGEIHGTEQGPGFVGELACRALAAGLGVTVALELPQEDQARVDAFLGSAGGPDDFDKLWSDFWRRDYQDGRASHAMAGLIDGLREQRSAGRPVEVVFLDRPDLGPSGGRDAAMAKRLADAHQAHPKNLILALTGNWHNRTVTGAPWDPSYEPMGYRLTHLLPEARILALDMSHAGGSAWLCLSGEPCKVQQLRGKGKKGGPLAVTVYDAVDAKGFHGVYDVGSITASLPAASRAAKPRP